MNSGAPSKFGASNTTNEPGEPASDTPDAAVRRQKKPYTTPVLKVYGTVAAITSTLAMDGVLKDGGPNNLKT